MTAILAFFLSPIGRLVSIGLVITAVLGGAYWKGDSNGSARVQARWDAAVAAAIERGEKARVDAEHDIGREPAGRVPNDKYDRDKGTM